MRPRIDPSSYTPFHEVLYDLRVRDAMYSNLVTLDPTATMQHAQELMRDHKIGGIPIIKDESLVGLVSIQDVIEALVENDICAPVANWMTKKVLTVRKDLPLIQAVNELQRHGYGRLPVVDQQERVVGILTSGDVTRAVMFRLNEEAEAAEWRDAARTAKALEPSEITGVETIETRVGAMDLDAAGTFASQVKKALKKRNASPDVVRRAAIAAYEVEVNVILHSLGGILEAFIATDEVTILARDQGPGIANVAQALEEGYSTANEVVRALGFGAGMGLPNMRRCADEFDIDAPASGTTVRMKIKLHAPDKYSERDARQEMS